LYQKAVRRSLAVSKGSSFLSILFTVAIPANFTSPTIEKNLKEACPFDVNLRCHSPRRINFVTHNPTFVLVSILNQFNAEAQREGQGVVRVSGT